jgi:hypothetical protein
MFTKLHNVYEHQSLSSYSKPVFFKSPEKGRGSMDYMKKLELNAGLLQDARKTLKQADHYMSQYNIDEKSPHHNLFFTALTIRLTLKNDPEIQKTRGNMKPDVYLRNKLRNLKEALKQVAGSLEKEKKRFTLRLRKAIYALPGNTKALRQLLSPEWRRDKIRLPRRFTFSAARFQGRTFLVLKNAKGELTISFTKKGRTRNYPLCIAGKIVNRFAMRTILKFIKPTLRERREYAQASLRKKHLETLQNKISRGRIAPRDIYPLLKVMKNWSKGIYVLPHKLLRVRVTAKNVILESATTRYFTLHTKVKRVTMAQLASHGNTTEILPVPYRPKRPQGAVAKLHPSLVGPQYLKTKGNKYVVKFDSKKEENAVKIHDVVGKPKDLEIIMVVKTKKGEIKYAAWDKTKQTWNEYDWDSLKPSKKRLQIRNGDAIVSAGHEGYAEDKLLRPKRRIRREKFEVK